MGVKPKEISTKQPLNSYDIRKLEFPLNYLHTLHAASVPAELLLRTVVLRASAIVRRHQSRQSSCTNPAEPSIVTATATSPQHQPGAHILPRIPVPGCVQRDWWASLLPQPERTPASPGGRTYSWEGTLKLGKLRTGEKQSLHSPWGCTA